jgi:hypothetical protein
MPSKEIKPVIHKSIEFIKSRLYIKNTEKTIAWCTLVIAITAVITNYSTCKQSKDSDTLRTALFAREDSVTRMQNRDNAIKNAYMANSIKEEDSVFQAENRAYVMCSTGSVVFLKGDDNNAVFYTDFMNVGKTPAYNARISITYDSMKSEPIFNFDTVATFTVAQYQTVHSNTSFSIGSKRIKLIQSGKRHLYVYGMMIYDDIFHRHHSSRFSVIYNINVLAKDGNCMFIGNNSEN